MEERTPTGKLEYSRIVALGPLGPIQQPVLATLQTQINATIPQANTISTIKPSINAVSQLFTELRTQNFITQGLRF